MSYLKSLLFVGLIGMLFACNNVVAQPQNGETSFYSLSALTLAGDTVDFESLKGKRVLIVNTASKCGFTPQYKELQRLYELARQDSQEFVILGFPCNQFGGQEPGTASEIQNFCSINYGVTFQLMEKVEVKGPNTHPVFKWLTQKSENAVMNYSVQWNFHKFLIDEEGRLVAAYNSRKSPLSNAIKDFALGN